MSESVLPMFSSGSFMVSSFMFVSLIHFVFIFPCGVRECSSHIVSALCSCLAFPELPVEDTFLFRLLAQPKIFLNFRSNQHLPSTSVEENIFQIAISVVRKSC